MRVMMTIATVNPVEMRTLLLLLDVSFSGVRGDVDSRRVVVVANNGESVAMTVVDSAAVESIELDLSVASLALVVPAMLSVANNTFEVAIAVAVVVVEPEVVVEVEVAVEVVEVVVVLIEVVVVVVVEVVDVRSVVVVVVVVGSSVEVVVSSQQVNVSPHENRAQQSVQTHFTV